MRERRRGRILSLTLCGTLACLPWRPFASAERPNILVVLADDLGYGDVGCYNPQSKVPTPNLDRLASQGIRFTDAHSPSTVCTPSRYGLLTGRMCFRTGLRGVFTGVDGPLIEPGRPTVATLLRDQGYRTACVGKWHVGMTFYGRDGTPVAPRGGGLEKVRQVDFSRSIAEGPTTLGFESFFGTACCPTTDWVYAYIEGDRFVESPTEMVEPTTKDWLEYGHFRRGLKAPGFRFRDVDLVFLRHSLDLLEAHVRERPDRPFFLYHATQAPHLPALPAERFMGKTNAGPLGDFIYELDYIVGELMAALDRLGIAEETLVIFTSDNGPEIVATHLRATYGHDSARPWRGFKRDNWEGGHRVPFIARWPSRIRAGSVSDETICLTDLMATFCAIVGTELPKGAGEDSVDILPALLGKETKGPLREYTIHQTIDNSLGIRRGRWKLLDHKGSGGNDYDEVARLRPYRIPDTDPDSRGQLYDLEADPGETRNLYGDRLELARELEELLHRHASIGPGARSRN